MHAPNIKEHEKAKRKRSERREMNDKAVLATALNSIWVIMYTQSMFRSYSTRGYLIYNMYDMTESLRDTFSTIILSDIPSLAIPMFIVL